MANKPTKRDRREASKRARVEAERKRAKQQRKNKLYVIVALLAVAGLIAGIVLASGKKTTVSDTKLNAAATAAGCDALVSPPDQGRHHFQTQAEGQSYTYDSNPPTSGSHFSIAGVAPAPTGVHNSPIPDYYQVHNLEHGHIGIQYASSISSEIRDTLEELTRSHPTFMFMAPRPNLPSGVVFALTAWDHLINCKSPTSATAVRALAQTFFDKYSGDGPEGALPGTPLS